MVVYNVTISIDKNVAEKWLQWMREVHIPDMMATGHFRDSKICRVHGEEDGGITYAITYTSYSKEDLEKYQKEHAPNLQAEHSKKFGGKFAAFRTVLSVIEEFDHKK
ncbi:MAG TPA: DUF4286 family protein [Ignavibacteriaceae bacterium]